MGWRVVKVAAGESAPAWRSEIAAGHWRQGQVLKQDGAATVRAARVCGGEVVIKWWPLDATDHLKSWLGLSRARRHWRGAERLRRLGVSTARPIALLRGEGGEALVMEHLRGPTLLEVMAGRPGSGGMSIRDQHALAAAVGRGLAALAPWFNRDHKPSNLIVTRAGPDPIVAVIDTVAIRPAVPEAAARMLSSLVLEPTGCGCPPRLLLRMRALTTYLAAAGLKTRGDRNHLWHRVVEIVRDHGDPTPRVNPLLHERAAAQPAATRPAPVPTADAPP